MDVSIFVCPKCQQRCVRQPHTGDFEHTCFGNETLQNEDVLVIGDWVDYTGSDTNVENALIQGTENTLFGTRADLEGAKFYPVNQRGFPKNRYRTRQHIEHINEDKFKSKGIPQTDPVAYEDYSL